MRLSIASRVGFLLLLLAPLACAQPAAAPATRKGSALHPAETPGEAMLRAMRAMGDADEAAYRRIVEVRSPHGYSESFARYSLAAARLEKAVRAHNVVGQRRREAGFDPNEKLATGASFPSATDLDAQRKAIEAIEWEVEGNIAHPKGKPTVFSSGTQGDMWIERSGEGWIVVIADPTKSARPEDLRQFAWAWSTKAAIFDAATQRVNTGEFKTILEVNDFMDAESKKVQRPKQAE